MSIITSTLESLGHAHDVLNAMTSAAGNNEEMRAKVRRALQVIEQIDPQRPIFDAGNKVFWAEFRELRDAVLEWNIK